MTKAKIEWIIKRKKYIDKMLKEGIKEKRVRISKRMEKIVIDENVKIVLGIIKEIIDSEEEEWMKKILEQISKGMSENYILSRCPVGRTKYYNIKNEFINKIYHCCICKQMVSYESVISTKLM